MGKLLLARDASPSGCSDTERRCSQTASERANEPEYDSSTRRSRQREREAQRETKGKPETKTSDERKRWHRSIADCSSFPAHYQLRNPPEKGNPPTSPEDPVESALSPVVILGRHRLLAADALPIQLRLVALCVGAQVAFQHLLLDVPELVVGEVQVQREQDAGEDGAGGHVAHDVQQAADDACEDEEDDAAPGLVHEAELGGDDGRDGREVDLVAKHQQAEHEGVQAQHAHAEVGAGVVPAARLQKHHAHAGGHHRDGRAGEPHPKNEQAHLERWPLVAARRRRAIRVRRRRRAVPRGARRVADPVGVRHAPQLMRARAGKHQAAASAAVVWRRSGDDEKDKQQRPQLAGYKDFGITKYLKGTLLGAKDGALTLVPEFGFMLNKWRDL
eukprot:scaffold301_cov243-Pinguiococcus_pyrenoidosus.AAC.76